MYEEVCARGLSPDPGSLRSSEGGSGQGGWRPEPPGAGTGRSEVLRAPGRTVRGHWPEPCLGGSWASGCPGGRSEATVRGRFLFPEGLFSESTPEAEPATQLPELATCSLGPSREVPRTQRGTGPVPRGLVPARRGLGLLVPGSTVRSRREARSLPCAGWPRLPGRLTCVAPVQGPGRARRVPEGAGAGRQGPRSGRAPRLARQQDGSGLGGGGV